MKRMLACVLTAVLCLTLNACTVYSYTPGAPTEPVFKPGIYDVTVRGNNGDVQVEVTFDEYRVKKIEVLSHVESAGLGDAALQTVADEIIAQQSFAVDTVSGATYSSAAMLQAVALAARAAGASDAPDISVESLLGEAGDSGEAGEEPDGAAGFVPGTYTATVEGYHGDVTVTVTVDEEKIVSMTAEGPNETEGVGSRAIDQLPAKIVEANSTKVDGISGATVTSNAIKRAVKEALQEAGPVA